LHIALQLEPGLPGVTRRLYIERLPPTLRAVNCNAGRNRFGATGNWPIRFLRLALNKKDANFMNVLDKLCLLQRSGQKLSAPGTAPNRS
jgi:hypothetical protein